MNKPAPVDHDIHPLLRERWSPRAFSDKPINDETLRSLFEAARWAPSCFNEQPWRFLVARREAEQEFQLMLSCLNETNQLWAAHGRLLVVTVAATNFARNGSPNRHAWHDVGLAVAQLTLQATAHGLAVHQMAGFSSERARELYGVPDGFDPVSALVIGYPGDPDTLQGPLKERELSARVRKDQSESVFAKAWGRAL